MAPRTQFAPSGLEGESGPQTFTPVFTPGSDLGLKVDYSIFNHVTTFMVHSHLLGFDVFHP